jgi:hypothetical protein
MSVCLLACDNAIQFARMCHARSPLRRKEAAQALGVTASTYASWLNRGVPAGRFSAWAEIIGIRGDEFEAGLRLHGYPVQPRGESGPTVTVGSVHGG